MTPAASSGGNARSRRNEVTNCAHTKNGNRIHVSPGARNWMIVARKFTAPSSDEVMMKTIPMSHTSGRAGDDGERRVGGPSGLRGTTRNEKADQHIRTPRKKLQ